MPSTDERRKHRAAKEIVHAQDQRSSPSPLRAGTRAEPDPRCCSISQSTVHDYLKRAETAGLPWPLPSDWEERQLEEHLFGRRVAGPPGQRRAEPDFASIHEQLQTHKHVTLQTAVGRVHRGSSRRLPLQPLLLALPALAAKARCRSPPATPRRRKALRRLRRGHGSRREPANGRSPCCTDLCRCSGGQFLRRGCCARSSAQAARQSQG